MSLTTRSDRWAIVAVALLTIIAMCALVLPAGDGEAAPTAPPTNTAEPTISGRAEQGRTLSASRGNWSGTGPISYRVPVGALRRRRRSPRRRRLRDRVRRDEPQSPARHLRRRLPHARARDGDERGRLSGRRVEPDGHRHRTAGQQVSALAARLDARRPGRDRRAGHVDRADRRSRSRIAGCAATRRAANASRSRAEDRGAIGSPPTTSDASSVSTSPHATRWDRRLSSRRSPPS